MNGAHPSMTTISREQIKGLFYHLVKQVGGVTAAAAFLDLSEQRVSQMQNIRLPDMPGLLHVAILESVVGQAVVTGVLARAATGDLGDGDLHEAACEAVEEAANVLKMVRTGSPHREIRQAALKANRESADVLDLLSKGQKAVAAAE